MPNMPTNLPTYIYSETILDVLTLSDFLYCVHTVLQSLFAQNKIVTGVFLENTTYVRNISHDF